MKSKMYMVRVQYLDGDYYVDEQQFFFQKSHDALAFANNIADALGVSGVALMFPGTHHVKPNE